MKVRKRVYSWNPHSKGARSLARELNWLRISHHASVFVPRPGHLVVNWGSSAVPEHVLTCRIVNKPGSVATASNKLATFQALRDKQCPGIPWFSTSKEEATAWMVEYPKRQMVARLVLNGHDGQGIRIVERPEDLPEAPLYVEYVPKKEEYRVHVRYGWTEAHDSMSVQQKKRKEDVPDAEVDWRIRNHGNGFIFARDNVRAPDPVWECARAAVRLLGLQFGAVDIGWNEKHQRAVLFEVNTAPGIEGSTLSEYAAFMRRLV